jgi:hypothetical protein
LGTASSRCLGIASIAGVGLARSVWQASLAVLVWNLFLWSGEILWLTLLGLTVPNHIRGRVSSIDYLGSYLLIPLSMALTGLWPPWWALGLRWLEPEWEELLRSC